MVFARANSSSGPHGGCVVALSAKRMNGRPRNDGHFSPPGRTRSMSRSSNASL
jgi:hypothetical protein